MAPLSQSNQLNSPGGYSLFYDPKKSGPLKNQLKTAAKGFCVYPMDLSALDLCKELGLENKVADSFFDQDQYNKIYGAITDRLIQLMFSPSLFPNINKEVNPLYIILSHLVIFYAGTLHRLKELQSVFKNAKPNLPLLFLESDYHYVHFSPACFYHHIFQATQVGGIQIHPLSHPCTSTDFSKRVPFSFVQWLSRGLPRQTFYSLRNSVIRATMPQDARIGISLGAVRHKEIRISLRNSQGVSFPILHPNLLASHTFNCGAASRDLKKTRELLHVINRELFSFVRSTWSESEGFYNHFETTILHLLNFYEKPFAWALRGFPWKSPQMAKSSPARSDLFHASGDITSRRTAYRSYLDGNRIHVQAYSDGVTGFANTALSLFNSPPIAERMYFLGEVALPHAQCFVDKNTLKSLNQVSILGRPRGLSVRQRAASKLKDGIIYIPTSYSGPFRQGTYREHHDLVYLALQKRMFAVFQKILARGLTDRVIFKAHPKGWQRPLPNIQSEIEEMGIRYSARPLEEELESCGLVVTDYFASAAVDSIMDGRPFLFLNSGVRLIHEAAISAIQKRCFYLETPVQGGHWDLPLEALLEKLSDPDQLNAKNEDMTFVNYVCGTQRSRSPEEQIAAILAHESRIAR